MHLAHPTPGSHFVCQGTEPQWSSFAAFESAELPSLQSTLSDIAALCPSEAQARASCHLTDKEVGSGESRTPACSLAGSQRQGQAAAQCPDSMLAVSLPITLCSKEAGRELPSGF